MHGLILASTVGLAFAISAQAAPLAANPASIELGAAPSVELVRDELWPRVASDPLARPMGQLAVG